MPHFELSAEVVFKLHDVVYTKYMQKHLELSHFAAV